MFEKGDVVKLPGMTCIVTRPAEEPDKEDLEMEIRLSPRVTGAPRHRHPRLQEEYQVIKGVLEVYLDRRWRSTPAGKSVLIPIGVEHSFRNSSADEVVLTNIHRPAHGFQAYWEEVGSLSTAGKLKSLNGLPTLVHLSVAMMQHTDDMVLTAFPERILVPMFARVGRAFGMGPGPVRVEAANATSAP